MIARAQGLLRRLSRDENGSVFVFVALTILVLMGMVGLALDGTRYFSLNSELQDLADAAALAGARELDGTMAKVTAAENLARNLLANSPRWGETGPTGSQVNTVSFAGPDNPDQILVNPAATAAAAAKARYIIVTTFDRGVIPTMLVAVGATTQTTSARAVATTNIYNCKVQPMMLCNPYEPTPFDPVPGWQFHLKPKGGGNNSFAPGDFGLVDPPGYTAAGANAIRDLLSQVDQPSCPDGTVNPRPGQATDKVKDGINVRFNYVPNGSTTGMDLTPAPIVTDGKAPVNPSNGNQCSNPDPWLGGGDKLPQDRDLTVTGGVDIGTGASNTALWADLDAYWASHYTQQDGSPMTWPSGSGPGYLNGKMTRYQAYLLEAQAWARRAGGPAPNPQSGDPKWKPTSEPVGPTCTPTTPAGPERRVISVSVVDCLVFGVQGNRVNNIWANKYADFFITEPSDDGSVYVEFIQLRVPGAGGGGGANGLKRVVQLVR